VSTPAAARTPAGGPQRLLVLVGPTALGKTAVAVAVAERLDAEIVVADSMQVYAGLPIVTNQPSPEQLRAAPHHLVGYVDPRSDYSAVAYGEAAHAVIGRLRAAGRPVVIEGGSGLYVRAALGDLSFGVPSDPELRARLERRCDGEGLAALVGELQARDPASAARIDTANPRRVVRALEVTMLQEAPLSEEQYGRLWQAPGRYPHLLVALEDDRELIRERIDARVREMIAGGGVDEVRRLDALGTPSRTVAQAIGVRELREHLAGRCSLEEAVAAMQRRTRRLVRRQITWMRKLPDAARLGVSGRPPGDVADEVVALLERS